jgi:hypothetical protein
VAAVALADPKQDQGSAARLGYYAVSTGDKITATDDFRKCLAMNAKDYSLIHEKDHPQNWFARIDLKDYKIVMLWTPDAGSLNCI